MSACLYNDVRPCLEFILSLIAAPEQCNFDAQTAKQDLAFLWNLTVKSVSEMAPARIAGKKSRSVRAEKRLLVLPPSSFFYLG